MSKFKWCFIGAGTLARHVASNLVKSGRHEIVSVYTRRPEAGTAFAKKYGGASYETPQEAINSENVDAVYVVTPHNSHYTYAKLAIELGKPVFCEKPFTVCAEETNELIALAHRKGVYIAEAMWTWFGEPAIQTKRLIDAGELGTITEAKLSYHMNSKNYAPRVTDPKRAGGALLDVGVYPITYLYRLFGYPNKIECKGILKDGIDLSEDVYLTFANGLRALATVSIDDMKGLESLYIKGDKAEIRNLFFHCSNKVKLKRFKGKNETFKGKTNYINEFDIVADEIRSGLTESKFVPLQATSDVMRIMDECRRQMGLTYDCLE